MSQSPRESIPLRPVLAHQEPPLRHWSKVFQVFGCSIVSFCVVVDCWQGKFHSRFKAVKVIEKRLTIDERNSPCCAFFSQTHGADFPGINQFNQRGARQAGYRASSLRPRKPAKFRHALGRIASWRDYDWLRGEFVAAALGCLSFYFFHGCVFNLATPPSYSATLR